MSTITLTDALTMHLRELLFEDLHERAELLAKAAHEAHEGPSDVSGDDARTAWASCGLLESAALLDQIGWSTREEADQLRARREAA